MDSKTRTFMIEKTRELIQAPTCSAQARAAGQAWLDAVGAGREAAETEKYAQALQDALMPIDGLIGFAESDAGKGYFGEDTAKGIAAHARDIQAAGAAYCDWPRLRGGGSDFGKDGPPAEIDTPEPLEDRRPPWTGGLAFPLLSRFAAFPKGVEVRLLAAVLRKIPLPWHFHKNSSSEIRRNLLQSSFGSCRIYIFTLNRNALNR